MRAPPAPARVGLVDPIDEGQRVDPPRLGVADRKAAPETRAVRARLQGPGEAEHLGVDIEHEAGDVAAAPLATRGDRGEVEQDSPELHGWRAPARDRRGPGGPAP
jgi:hypothetical protein